MRKLFLAAAALAVVCMSVAFGVAGTGRPPAQRRNLDAVKLELRNIPRDRDAAQVEPAQFELGRRVHFRLTATNNSTETVYVPSTDPYYQNRPRLRAVGGDEVPYRGDIAKLVKAKDAEPMPTFISRNFIPVRPSEQRELETIDLSDWYPKLKPGVYELTVSHRFDDGGERIDLPPVTFEVVSSEGNPDGPQQ